MGGKSKSKQTILMDIEQSDEDVFKALKTAGFSDDAAIDTAYFIKNKMQVKRKTAYVCSPCRASTRSGIIRNMQAARTYCRIASDKLGVMAKAPHAWMPEILDDNIPEQREIAIDIGVQILLISDVLLVCGDRITSGMKNEIRVAAKEKIPIVVFNPILINAVQGITKDFSVCICFDSKSELSKMGFAPEKV